jgi:monothiol glutaredoxin
MQRLEEAMERPTTQEQWSRQIDEDVHGHHVFIYAKGDKNAAMCGFSHRVMEVFNRLGVDFEVRNIFSDPMIRPAVCAYTSWPTIPQVFVGGKFIGGCDIVTEMYESGELQKLLAETKPAGG